MPSTLQRFNASTLQRFNASTLQRFNASTVIRFFLFFVVPVFIVFSLISTSAHADGPSKKAIHDGIEQRANAVKDERAPPAPDGANAKIADRTCSCHVSCMGQDRSRDFPFGQIIIIKTADRQRCANTCQDYINQNINIWAAEQKTCPNFSCGGDSKLSTGDSIGVGPTTISTPGCGGGGDGSSPASACCAPITGDDVYSQFQFNQTSQGANNFYIMTFNPNNTALNDKMNAFATLAGLMQRGCNPSSVVYTIKNTVTGAVMATITVKYTGSGAPQVTSNPANLGMVQFMPTNPATKYNINAHAGCDGYTAKECKDRGFNKTFGFDVYKKAGGGDPSVEKY